MAKYTNLVFENVNHNDHPDYSDAFILYCEINGKIATDAELDEINNDSDLVHELLMEQLN